MSYKFDANNDLVLVFTIADLALEISLTKEKLKRLFSNVQKSVSVIYIPESIYQMDRYILKWLFEILDSRMMPTTKIRSDYSL